MKNKKTITSVVTLIIGILMVSVGVIGLNYKKINRMIDNVADKTQSSVTESSENNEADAADIAEQSDNKSKLSKDEKAVSKLVDQYMEAQISCDASGILFMQPEEVINAMGTYVSWMFEDQEEYFRVMSEEMANNWEELQESLDGAEYTITYEIAEFMDMTEEEITDYRSGYSIYTMLGGELNMEITDAKKVVVDLYVNYDGTTVESGSMTPTFIKVDGEWYLGMN